MSRGRSPARQARTGSFGLPADLVSHLHGHWRSIDQARKDRLLARCSDLLHPATNQIQWLSSKLSSICFDLCLAGWETVMLCAALRLSDVLTFTLAGRQLFELFYAFAQEEMQGALVAGGRREQA